MSEPGTCPTCGIELPEEHKEKHCSRRCRDIEGRIGARKERGTK